MKRFSHVFLGRLYSDREILFLLDHFRDGFLAVDFLPDRVSLDSVTVVYSLQEWKEPVFPELDLEFDHATGRFYGLIPLKGAASICYRFKIVENRSIRWEDREKRNWFINTSRAITYSREDHITARTAELLSSGAVIGWFQGRSEFGSRALGNRSLLADPRSSTVKDRLNSEIKKREWFRPYAPAVLEEAAADYFTPAEPSPFMMLVAEVKREKRSLIPAVTHIDGTARYQTVSREPNPRFHELISEFERITGVPVLLNTSFNLADEPIVETPLDALSSFLNAPIDYLVIGDFLVSKL
ncbi:MAG: carbamoyltransferase C-terminal domain-containing protein [Candidatus Wallbacteria bacterium]|nr:carbamoyltransferase C-terminal domain-containing protein [Candidatus Wallbacteria bacterium]